MGKVTSFNFTKVLMSLIPQYMIRQVENCLPYLFLIPLSYLVRTVSPCTETRTENKVGYFQKSDNGTR